MKIDVTQHCDIDVNLLKNIIEIKSVAWPYSVANQIKWLSTNLKTSDFHVLLNDHGSYVAYLNLIHIDILIDEISKPALGLGNVCAKERGKNYGTELMKSTNDFLLENKRPGLLFCKEETIGFYSKCDWEVIPKAKIKVSFDSPKIAAMSFNLGNQYSKINYCGVSF